LSEMFKVFLTEKKNVTIFKKINPSAFFILYFFLSIAALISFNALVEIVLLAISFLFLLLSKVKFQYAKYFIIIGFWFGAFLWLIITFTGLYGGHTFYSFYLFGALIKISYGNLYVGFDTFLKVLSLVIFTAVFVVVLDPREIVEAFSGLRLPYNITLSLALMFRNFAIFANDYEIIVQAQKSRALDINKGNIFQRLKKLLGIIIPLVYLSLKRADDLVNALETKNYDPKSKRSSFFEYKITAKDYFIILFSVITFVIVFILNYYSLPFLNFIGVA